MVQSLSGKVKERKQILLFIAMHYWGTKDWSSLFASSSQWSSSQSSILVEALLWGCHLDVHGLFLQQFLSSAVIQYCCLFPVLASFSKMTPFNVDWYLTVATSAMEETSMSRSLLSVLTSFSQMMPSEQHFTWNGRLEVSGCWTAVIRRQGWRSNLYWPVTSYPQLCMA